MRFDEIIEEEEEHQTVYCLGPWGDTNLRKGLFSNYGKQLQLTVRSGPEKLIREANYL